MTISSGMTTLWTTTTPVAPWTVIADGEVVTASGFAEPEVMVERLDLSMADVTIGRIPGVSDAVEQYLTGDLDALDKVSVRQPGGPFHQEVWTAMREIPAGATWSYRELATKAGRPSATRAAASGCARNLVAPFVPCHRVVRTDGSLGGYRYGLDVKTWLLEHEQR